jgi:hypothetical protein
MGEKVKILSSGEWDLLAVVAASILGIILHILDVIPESYVISLILLLLCLHALHEISHAMKYDQAHERFMTMDQRLTELQPDVELIAKDHFLKAEELALHNRGEMWWFNTPMTVLKSQEAFDRLVKPAMENPKTTNIEFVLDRGLEEFFMEEVQPKIEVTKGKEKVRPPVFTDIKESLGFRMIDTDEKEERKEAHLTFLDEPFTIAKGEEKKVYYPRFIFHVKADSELIPKLKELYLRYRLD